MCVSSLLSRIHSNQVTLMLMRKSMQCPPVKGPYALVSSEKYEHLPNTCAALSARPLRARNFVKAGTTKVSQNNLRAGLHGKF
jgi:hypothetical protein